MNNNARHLPSPTAVRQLYRAASRPPPLNESASTADLFAAVYEAAVAHEDVTASALHCQGRLTAFAYGHPWRWNSQQSAWAQELNQKLGDAASRLEDTTVLCLFARHPSANGRGLGRAVLNTWLAGLRHSSVWLATSDIPSPARGIYEALGFEPVGYGPDAPNGAPALVMMRLATGASPAAPGPTEL